jgi:hypothetical protein
LVDPSGAACMPGGLWHADDLAEPFREDRARGFGAYDTRGLNILQKSTLILGTR